MKKNNDTLHLILKKKWWDMIESGVKTEEYRDVKPYWEKRLIDYKRLKEYYLEHREELAIKRVLFPHRPVIENITEAFKRDYTHVCFHLGYTSTTMTFEIDSISIGKGNPEWGAPKEDVFIIKLGKRLN